MNILIIGEEKHALECRQKFGTEHNYLWEKDHREGEKFIVNQGVVFDFILDEDPELVDIYADHQAIVFINTSKISLADLVFGYGEDMKSTLFGFNGLPTFLNRPVMEVSLFNHEEKFKLEKLCKELKTEFLLVDDRVGLVTPRVICMIINEAYYTVQDKTASREDIDLAMKLGMNYPYGPFEWCQRIGIKHVYELLEAVYDDTKDERYKICALLKKEYLRV